ncbi:hypothetical protein BRYFOR_08744 [Marvinbryantia formatexigens DSM 14469]|uniref:Uncharacterized protein n=1 Tax=Marvinbryantia formatexigens DSM 14469 TaxID=478749 RepID=C6LJA8_9FIRM|nr:hypothetical protein BRYFOR_08744 [Marvinbryantia formatexigens DSM 14469]
MDSLLSYFSFPHQPKGCHAETSRMAACHPITCGSLHPASYFPSRNS